MDPEASAQVPTPVITLSSSRIKQSVLDCLAEAYRRIVSNDLTRATTLKFWIDGRFGQCGVSLNDDDDVDFQWTGGTSLTIGCIYASPVAEIADLEERYSTLSSPDPESEEMEAADPIIVLNDRDSANEVSCDSLCDFCSHLGQEVAPWVREWIAARDPKEWVPCCIVVEEINSYSGDCWRDERRQLPPARELPRAAFFVGLKVTQGLKVYKAGGWARGFAHGNLDRSLRLNRQSLVETLTLPVPITIWANNSRVGGLASLGGGFALRADHPACGEARALLGDATEWLPANDGKLDWLVPNVLAQGDVIDPDATKFDGSDPDKRSIRIAEFVPDLLNQIKHRAFTVLGDSGKNLFFLERPGEESFPEFCWRVGLVGVRWQLVWCEDTHELEKELGDFVREIEARVARKTQTRCPESVLNYEGIYGGQLYIWKVAKFREILRESGLPQAIEEIQGLGSIEIPSVKKICISDWWYLNRPKNPAIEKALAESLANRDLLHEVRGYLCNQLPMQLQALREMEAGDTGELAAYGPAV
jgi:hypothetical protein